MERISIALTIALAVAWITVAVLGSFATAERGDEVRRLLRRSEAISVFVLPVKGTMP